MGTVTEYLEKVSADNRVILERIVGIARELAPDAEEGTSYGMPALLVNGKGFLSVLETKNHLALYPFSGQILPEMAEELGGYSWSPGTLRFSADNPVPDSLVRRILETRLAAIRR
ncbi:iron chaperone [Paenarthrobacter sp. NPDC092416]|uniref:iron chaperone n=1 Tax=Paenarthrobacter sp. NPDC092416 TaxID=3364386 RepID=UPI0037F5A8A4